MGSPNLDCMAVEELRECAEMGRGSSLANYAKHKAWAVEYRMAGDIKMALNQEGICDRIYGRLKSCQKW